MAVAGCRRLSVAGAKPGGHKRRASSGGVGPDETGETWPWGCSAGATAFLSVERASTAPRPRPVMRSVPADSAAGKGG